MAPPWRLVSQTVDQVVKLCKGSIARSGINGRGNFPYHGDAMNTDQTTVYEAFLSLLDDAIREAGSSYRLAELLDVPPNLITRWKNRERIPRLDSIQPVIDYLGRGFSTAPGGGEPSPVAAKAADLQKAVERLRRENSRLLTENTMQRGEIAALEKQLSRLAPAPDVEKKDEARQSSGSGTTPSSGDQGMTA